MASPRPERAASTIDVPGEVATSGPDPLIVVDALGIVLWANPAAERFFGWPVEERIGASGLDLVHPDDLELVLLSLDSVGGKEVGLPIEIRVRTPDGYVLTEIIGATSPALGEGAVVLSVRDLTQRRRFEVAHDADARFRAIVHHASTLMLLLSSSGDVESCSAAVTRILGHDPEEIEGASVRELLDSADWRHLEAILLSLPGTGTHTIEVAMRRRAGGSVPFELTVVDLRDDPTVGGFVVSGHDIAERKRLEAQLAHQAFHDALTGLANQTLFRDRVSHALARRRGERPLAALFCDLDHFKNVNDSMGHPAGDALLQVVADRLRSCLRSADTAARLGGDEFAVLLEDVDSREGVLAIADRILAALRPPIAVGGTEVVVTASIGVAFAERHVTTEALLRNADLAMYTAKVNGRGRREVYEPRMHATAVARLELEAELRRAVSDHQLRVHYQPMISLSSGEVVGAEALVRWQHPRRGLIGPGDFLAVAEPSDLVAEIGSVVLAEACRDAAAWQPADGPPIGVSVNLAARQLTADWIVDEVRGVLHRTGLAPELLTLELTEGALVADVEAASRNAQGLHELGVALAVDDFGTGYSSLSHLSRFPIDVLKVDRSFVDGIDRGAEASAMTRAVVRLGQTLGLTIVAEGVERESQVEALVAIGCELAQGYLFGRPHALPEAGWLR